jgi:lysophospholipase L1-like esterase
MTKIEFANHGVPGAPGSFVVEQWLSAELDPARRELAVFCFGTNDALLKIDEDETLAVLERALDRAEDLRVPTFVIGPPPVGDDAEADHALADLSSVMHQITMMHAVPFLPTFDALGPGSVWRSEAQAGDGTHPGAGGYAELTELLRTGGLTEWMLAMASR